MSKLIFINYRREDAQSAAGRLYDMLEKEFNKEEIFFDVDNIEPGSDFVIELSSQVSKCDIFLAVIGRHWLDARSDNGRRLDNPNDWVRIEIETALRENKHVIPVLVDGAQVPRLDNLPESLQPFVRCNAVRLTHERFKTDVQGLIAGIKRLRENRTQRLADANALVSNPELSSILSAVTLYLDMNSSLRRAILISNDDAGADLCIYRESDQTLSANAPFELALFKKNAAWNGAMAGTRAWLEVSNKRALLINSGNEAIGRSRWSQTLTIIERDGEFFVAEIMYQGRDTLNPNAGGSYEINFLTGKGKRNGKRITITTPAPKLADWSDERRPKECFI